MHKAVLLDVSNKNKLLTAVKRAAKRTSRVSIIDLTGHHTVYVTV